VCDDRGRPLGYTRPRALVHRDGDWHRSFHCWVVHGGSPSNPLVLLQRRSPTKDTWAGLWDVSVAGHYSAGEGIEGGLREIREELGLDVPAADLVHVGWRREQVYHENGVIEREVQDIVFLHREVDLLALRPEPQEVTGVASIPFRQLLRLTDGQLGSFTAPGVRVASNGCVTAASFALYPPDLVSRSGGYYGKAARLAARLRAGRGRVIRRRWW